MTTNNKLIALTVSVAAAFIGLAGGPIVALIPAVVAVGFALSL